MKACNFDNKHHINNQIKSPFQAILAYKTVSNLCFYRAKHQTEQSAKIVTDVVWSVCVSLCESVSVSVGKKTIYPTTTDEPIQMSKVTVHCLLHGFLDTHLLIHSWCDIAWNRVGTVNGKRWRLGPSPMGRSNLGAMSWPMEKYR